MVGALVALVGFGTAVAGGFATEATGIGSQTGRGALLVRTSSNDSTGRVDKAWLVVETACPFAPGSKRRVRLDIKSISDLANNQSCKVHRSWMCMRLTKKAAKDSGIEANDEKGLVEFVGGNQYVVADGAAFPIVRAKPKPTEDRVAATWSGTVSKGFSFVGDGFSVRTEPRVLCMSDGLGRFFSQHDPALDGKE